MQGDEQVGRGDLVRAQRPAAAVTGQLALEQQGAGEAQAQRWVLRLRGGLGEELGAPDTGRDACTSQPGLRRLEPGRPHQLAVGDRRAEQGDGEVQDATGASVCRWRCQDKGGRTVAITARPVSGGRRLENLLVNAGGPMPLERAAAGNGLERMTKGPA
ncbi:hypothetical protein D3C85_654660 [compost metagenome]